MNANETSARVCSVCGRDESAIASELVEIDGELYCEDCAHAEGYARCAGCGEWYDADDLPLNIGGELLCEDCAHAEGYARCADCGGWVSPDDLPLYIGGELLCKDCAHSAGWEVCGDCGGWVSPDEQVLVDEGTLDEKVVCRDCYVRGVTVDRYFECAECGTVHSHSYALGRVAEARGDYVCLNCADMYTRCDNCGDYVREGEGYYDDSNDQYFCESCWEELEENGDGYIDDYSYKPDPYFFYTDGEDRPRSTYSYTGSQLTFGLELEIDHGNNRGGCAKEVHDKFDDLVYMKNDSSVDFELVTHPCTLDYHRKHFDWAGLCSIPLLYGYKSHDARTCGLHIHVGRAQLGDYGKRDDNIAKIILLMYRHWDALTQFSRRSGSQLDRWAHKPELDLVSAVKEADLKSIALDSVDGDRYFALNTCNYNTIEFRLWNGSLVPDTVLATIELTSNICLYAMSASFREVCESKWTDITSFEPYAELTAYLGERGLLTDDRYTPSEIKLCENSTDDRYTPSEIKLCENSTANGMTASFHVGDRVRVVRQANRSWFICDAALREHPTGVIVDYNADQTAWVIHFDEPHDYGHTCIGRVPDGQGYYVRPECIELVHEDENEDAITIGAEVELRPNSMYYNRFINQGTSIRGQVFTVRSGMIGVYFPGLTCGHTLDGALPTGNTHGWWVNEDDIILVNTNTVSA